MTAGPVDLHTHSTSSDGTLSPGELVHAAAAAGIEMLALTDHDTTAGIAAAHAAAHGTPLALVPGVELSASWRSQTLHILGLWIDPAAPALEALLDAQAERRVRRIEAMCARLTRVGLPGDALLASVRGAAGIPTRTHLARALLEGGHVRRLEEAFRRYLGSGKPAHVSAGWPPLTQVIEVIRAAGGSASLAHPGRYALSAGARRALLGEFAAAGGCALEVVTGGNGAAPAAGLAELAVKHGLKATVGSDYHGPGQAWNPLGRLAKLPDSVTPLWRGRD